MKQLDIESLLEELTLEEKISLLAGRNAWETVPIDRLDIPSVTVSDGPNGIRGTRFFNAIPSNCFTCGTGMASSFNKDLWEQAGRLMGVEAKMKGVHCILGPTTCIVRSPLGGRNFESYSEDPLLSGLATSHVVAGIQSQNIMACIKHFVCNDQEDLRRGIDILVTERALREIYLKPFQIAVRESRPKSLMTSYNKVNGEHVSESKKLLQDVLRGEWAYDGTVMSDWYGVYSITDSIKNGLNLEMPGPTRFRQEIQTVHKVLANEIHRDDIDKNVRYILKFVNESLRAEIPPDLVPRANESAEASRLLRQIGSESIVLLKNNGILPLSVEKSPGNESIAIIGPNAKSLQIDSGGGSASMRTRYKVTTYDGVSTRLAANSPNLHYSLGAYLDKTTPDLGPHLKTNGKPGLTAKFFLDPPEKKDRVPFDVQDMDTTKIFVSDYKNDHLPAGSILFYCDFEGVFTPEETATYEFGCACLGTAQIFVDGKLVVDNKTKQVRGDDFFLGAGTREEKGDIDLEAGKSYTVKVEFGTSPTKKIESEYSEAGGVFFGARVKLSAEEALSDAVELAKKVDKVIVDIGISKEWESEGFDRTTMDIPGDTNKLVAEIAKVNKNVIVVNHSGSPIGMPWIDDISAFVQAWYGGNEAGNALADILFGDVNPSAKLSMTFPEKLEDNPSFLNFGSTNGRMLYGEDIFVGYRFYEKTLKKPVFPFGYGLSYTSFELSNLKVETDSDNVNVSVDVTNTGKTDGAEVVQVYVAAQNPSVVRPKKELKGFDKVFVKSGETKTASVKITIKEAASYWNTYYNKWSCEKDTYNILVGNSSDNIVLQDSFIVHKTLLWSGL